MASRFLDVDPPLSPLTLSPEIPSQISPQPSPKSGASRIFDDGEVSPISPDSHYDLSRLSGFPQLSAFNFGFESVQSGPESPSGIRRPSDSPQPPLISNPSATSSTAAVSNAVPGGVHREMPQEEIVDPPPPYTRYVKPPAPALGAGAAPWTPGTPMVSQQIPIDRQRQSSYPTPTHRDHARFASAAGIPGRHVHALTLHDLQTAGYGTERIHEMRSAAEAGRRDIEAADKRRRMWRGRWLCPAGGCCGFAGAGEKRGLTSRGKLCLLSTLMIIVIVAIIVGSVVGTTVIRDSSTPVAPTSLDSPNMVEVPGFPALPVGENVIKPQGRPIALTTCAAPPTLWSCDLPPGSLFPQTNSPSDRSVLPEFRFIIRLRNSTDGPESLWTPSPDVPSTADYEQVGSKPDGVVAENKTGVESSFYVSLVTDVASSHSETIASSARTRNRKFKRQSSDDFTDPADTLPKFMKNQPLRLFDKGLPSEHYGFHAYFQKSIYVRNILPSNATADATGEDPDANGGVSGSDARYIVNWENVRFKVSIWTRKREEGAVDLIDEGGSRRSKVDGGFPYAVSVWEDRVGGNPRARTVSAYEIVESGGNRTRGKKVAIAEKVGVGTEVRGCYCEWRNWRAVLDLR